MPEWLKRLKWLKSSRMRRLFYRFADRPTHSSLPPFKVTAGTGSDRHPSPLRPQNHSEPQGLNHTKIAFAPPWRYRERLSSCSARSGCAGPAPESDASSRTKTFPTSMLHANTSIDTARPEANQAGQETYAGQGGDDAAQHSADIFYAKCSRLAACSAEGNAVEFYNTRVDDNRGRAPEVPLQKSQALSLNNL